MKRAKIIATAAAVVMLVDAWATASAAPYTPVGHYVRGTSTGTLYAMRFKAGPAQGCPGPTYVQPCYVPGGGGDTVPGPPTTSWNDDNGIITAVIAAGLPSFDWNGTTLTGTGLYWASAQSPVTAPGGFTWFSDKVVNLTINTSTTATNATSYDCLNGNLLGALGLSACENISLGANFIQDSTAVYNVGGNAKCVTLTISGDDFSRLGGSDPPYVPGTPNPRGLTVQAADQAGAGCAQTSAGVKFQTWAIDSGAFDLWNVIQDDATYLILANTTVANLGPCYLYGFGAASACPADTAYAGVAVMVFTPVDSDTDGLADRFDNCPGVANANQADSDGDLVGNMCDNCRTISNASQCNSNTPNDAFGNRCDGDLNGNNATNAQDYAIFRSRLGTADADADLNCNGGNVNAQDYSIFRTLLGSPPGPGAGP